MHQAMRPSRRVRPRRRNDRCAPCGASRLWMRLRARCRDRRRRPTSAGGRLGYDLPMVMRGSSFLLALIACACSRPQSEPAPAREPAAPSAQVVPSSTSTTSGSPGPAPPPATPNVAPPSAVAAKSAGPPREGCDGLFDPPAGAVQLCDEHVLGDGAEIHWTSWAVNASRTETFHVYQQRAGECSGSSTSSPPLLSVSRGDARLSVHDANERGYPSCAARPGPDRPTVVVISTKREHP